MAEPLPLPVWDRQAGKLFQIRVVIEPCQNLASFDLVAFFDHDFADISLSGENELSLLLRLSDALDRLNIAVGRCWRRRRWRSGRDRPPR